MTHPPLRAWRGAPYEALASPGRTPPPIILLQQAPSGAGAKPFQRGDGLVRFYMASADTAARWVRRIPGGIVALIVSRGNVHDYSRVVLIVANVVCYSCTAYFVLTCRARRQQNRPE